MLLEAASSKIAALKRSLQVSLENSFSRRCDYYCLRVKNFITNFRRRKIPEVTIEELDKISGRGKGGKKDKHGGQHRGHHGHGGGNGAVAAKGEYSVKRLFQVI